MPPAFIDFLGFLALTLPQKDYLGGALRPIGGNGERNPSEFNRCRHCEEPRRGDEAIQISVRSVLDCFASLAMTAQSDRILLGIKTGSKSSSPRLFLGFCFLDQPQLCFFLREEAKDHLPFAFVAIFGEQLAEMLDVQSNYLFVHSAFSALWCRLCFAL